MFTLNTVESISPPYFSYKGRSIDPSKKVRLYRNLHNGKISIKQGSLVVGHTDNAVVSEVRFIVSEKRRQKVLSSKQKNVHAYIEGYWQEETSSENGCAVWYNPYKTEYFRTETTNEPCHTAEKVSVSSDGHIQMWN